MTNGWLLRPLLAEKSLLQGLGDRFRFENAQLDSSDLVAAIAIFSVGAGIVWSMATYLRRSERPKTVDNPKKLFQELCQAHRLARHEAALLRSVADVITPDNQSLLFIDPGLLDIAILDSRWSDVSPELARYRELLFGESEATTPAETTTAGV
jgi:hypothetical protein